MAAYGAAISLKNTTQRILQSSRISVVPPSPEILQPAYDAMARLQEVVLKLDETGYSKMRTKVNALDDRIKEVIWEFEDLLESHYTNQILPQLESSGDHMAAFSVDLQSLRHSVDCFVDRVTVMEVEYDDVLLNMPEEEGEPISSRIDFGGINSQMLGLCEEFEQARQHLLEGNSLAVVGMAGVGKTSLAKKVFDDPLIQGHFELRAWVKVGRKCESSEILRCILAQLDPNTHNQMLTQRDDDDDVAKLVGLLKERLKDTKCLIVLDDVWKLDTMAIDNLPREIVQILLTSRLGIKEYPNLRVRLLNLEESMKLLGREVFGEKGFPPHLEKLGKKIAKRCEGLPLVIITIAQILSKEDKTLEYWTEVAEKQHSSAFVDAYDQILEVLFPSYDYLPQYLKMLFLYMGVFPPYGNIEREYLFHRLSAEGFLEPSGKQTLKDFMDEETLESYMVECSVGLVIHYNLVLLELSPEESWFSTKEFRVHSCWQHLCRKEASKIKFFHVLQSWDDVVKDQRRLCVHSNTLFAFKQVCDTIKSDCASTVRSLLCLGPYYQYPVPIHDMDFKLLRVLDAFKVRFYHIPRKILKLVCLKYLALTCNEEIPIFISKLLHLQFLIIGRHMNIQRRGVLSYMPRQIWDMQELQHIKVMGKDLPTPNSSDACLGKLSNLVGVSAKSCTREILKRIPNLKNLVIVMELKPYDDDDDSNTLSRFGYISEELRNLVTLSYTVLNPDMKHGFMVPLSMFPSSLTRLELSGLGCPWKHTNDIGRLLPNLKILKLQQYAFQGQEWDIELGCFFKLETLIIGDTDLVRWRPQHGSLPRLELLSMRHCYKLQQLDWTRDASMVITPTIELIDCSLVVVVNAMQLPESLFQVHFHCSLL
ncbi:putative late blight resistance protein homolog R1A-10 [Salvia splendens]|uniref:putative late blight resistance protein homolog R1A-10 n=1 Tax=Salvia splendens TaxID=180675 RepID=UPI001C255156|nr:putative late blight resistance protein homolog R1A-10 [Salvia splendens]